MGGEFATRRFRKVLWVIKNIYMHIMENLNPRLEIKELELMAVVAKKISVRRNSMIHGSEFTHPSQLVRLAYECFFFLFFGEFKRVRLRSNDEQVKCLVHRVQVWKLLMLLSRLMADDSKPSKIEEDQWWSATTERRDGGDTTSDA